MSAVYVRRDGERKALKLGDTELQSCDVPVYEDSNRLQPVVSLLHNVPVFLVEAFGQIRANGLNVEGIFRREGNSKRVDMLTTSFYGQVGIPVACTVHDICSMVKRFFRDLQVPLLCNLQEQFIACTSTIEHEPTRVKTVLELCYVLPPTHVGTLAFLMRQLKTVSEHSDRNRMDLRALSTVLAPSIFHGDANSNTTVTAGLSTGEAALHRMRDDIQSKAAVIELLIKNADKIGVLTPWEKSMSPRNLLPEDRRKQQPLYRTQTSRTKLNTGRTDARRRTSSSFYFAARSSSADERTAATAIVTDTSGVQRSKTNIVAPTRKEHLVDVSAMTETVVGEKKRVFPPAAYPVENQDAAVISAHSYAPPSPAPPSLYSVKPRNRALSFGLGGHKLLSMEPRNSRKRDVESRSRSSGVRTMISTLTNKLRLQSPGRRTTSITQPPPLNIVATAAGEHLFGPVNDNAAAMHSDLTVDNGHMETSEVRSPNVDVTIGQRSMTQQAVAALDVRKGIIRGKRRFTTPIREHALSRHHPKTVNTGLKEPTERKPTKDVLQEVEAPSSAARVPLNSRLSQSTGNLACHSIITSGGLNQAELSSSVTNLLSDNKTEQPPQKPRRQSASHFSTDNDAATKPSKLTVVDETLSPFTKSRDDVLGLDSYQLLKTDTSTIIDSTLVVKAQQWWYNAPTLPPVETPKKRVSVAEMTDAEQHCSALVSPIESNESSLAVLEDERRMQPSVDVLDEEFVDSNRRRAEILTQSDADQVATCDERDERRKQLTHFPISLRPSVAYILEQKKGIVKNRISVYQQNEQESPKLSTPRHKMNVTQSIGTRVATPKQSVDSHSKAIPRTLLPTICGNARSLKRLGTNNNNKSPKSSTSSLSRGGGEIVRQHSFLKSGATFKHQLRMNLDGEIRRTLSIAAEHYSTTATVHRTLSSASLKRTETMM